MSMLSCRILEMSYNIRRQEDNVRQVVVDAFWNEKG